MSENILIIGAGGHAKVLLNALQLSSVNVLGLTDSDPTKHGSSILGCPVLGDDTMIDAYDLTDVRLIIGIGSIETGSARQDAFERFQANGFTFSNCVHPSASVAPDVKLAPGSQVMAGVIIQPGCVIGMNSIINTRTSVDHDCQIGDHAHIAPGAVLAGTVTVADHAQIGIGASIIQGVHIGEAAMIAAGATVIRDVPARTRVGGTPAQAF
jgi:UDP-perosamine 4-acetyltransferase